MLALFIRAFSIVCLLSITDFPARCQIITNKSKIINITSGDFSDSLFLGGYLDGFNTITNLSFSDRLESEIFRAFEPMISVRISNKGSKSIKSPRLTFNNRGQWYDHFAISEETFNKASDAKEKVLLLWKFLNDNIYHYEPANMDSYRNLNELLVYGYGPCDMTSLQARILLNNIGISTYSYLMPHHTVNIVQDNELNMLFDSDLKAFYLNLENNDFADIDEILNDRYLIKRTKHFGKNVRYDKEINDFVSRIYYPDILQSGEMKPKLSQPIQKITSFNYDFNLKPGESVIFEWDEPKFWYHEWNGNTQVPESFKKYVIANGKYIFNTDFQNVSLIEIFENFNEVVTTSVNGKPCLRSSGNSSHFTIMMQSPFPILDVKVKGIFFLNSINDSLEVYYSSDNIAFERKWLIKGAGLVTDSLDLTNSLSYKIADQIHPFTYKYYLKFLLHNGDTLSNCGIDSLYIENIFQVSRLFMPSLQLGQNFISYRDSDKELDKNVEVEIKWNESYENNPPLPVAQPIFPADMNVVDSLYFSFTWSPAIDPDGDEIEDYEFYLSDRSDLLYPLAPNFNIYISSFGEDVKPYFKVKETGWLNDGTTYYWKVRAKDSRGAWGAWSETWSFTPKGVMRPLNCKVEDNVEYVRISWGRNSIGKNPDYYKIYASDETHGFYPDAPHFIMQTSDTLFSLLFNEIFDLKTFYRITACTNDGQESAPSDVIELLAPYLFYSFDSIVPNKPFRMKFETNKKYTPYKYFTEDTLFKQPEIIFESIPYWMRLKNDFLVGYPDEDILKKMVFSNDLSYLCVRLVDEDSVLQSYQFNIETPYLNNPPSLFINEVFAFYDNEYNALISTNDEDILYGDYHEFEVIDKPDWLNYRIEKDTVYLFGTPDILSVKKRTITVKAIDSKGFFSINDFKIKIYNRGDNRVDFFPNPVDHEAMILLQLEEDSKLAYDFYSMNGIKMNQFGNIMYCKKGVSEIPVDLQNLYPGTYLLKTTLTNSSGKNIANYSFKIIKL